MLNVGIVGAAGYTGEALIDILLGHPEVRITSLSRRSAQTSHICDIFPRFAGRLDLSVGQVDLKQLKAKCDAVFLALPHTASMELVPKLLSARKKVIDLSADYRLKDTRVYRKFYNVTHKDAANLKSSVYGLPELYRNKIKGATLVANPGCYPTAALLALAPLAGLGLADTSSIIIDAKSGTSGAGKKAEEGLLFSEVHGDFKAYKVNAHQHMPEIDQVLSRIAQKKVQVVFVPHLLPVKRGILATVYARKSSKAKSRAAIQLFRKFYKKEPFIRVRQEGDFPRLADVQGTNFCDIGIKEEKDCYIVIAAIDNLLKGASGQAVQNMNIMYKFPETLGLL